MSSPSHVLAHFGAPPITPTEWAHQSCSTSQRSASSSLGSSATRTTGSTCSPLGRHRHTFAFFLSAGRVLLG